jgi:HD-GYP domain-containing protein (c-di-GMP phosphodiesterase class II)
MKSIDLEGRALMGKYKKIDEIKDLILLNNPNGVLILNKNGIVEYVNPAFEKLMGSNKIVGLDAKEFHNIKDTPIYEGILDSLKGEASILFGIKYCSYFIKENMILNVYINPILNKKDNVERIIIHIHDVSREFKLKNEIESNYLSTIEAFAETVDARDAYTGKHSSNVSKYVSLLCKRMKLSKEEKEEIGIAASIHDIGKVGISDSILKKPEKLTYDEYEIMKKHPVIGANIVGKIHGYENASNIIRHHHERYDGKGYPDGLAGSDIPIGSQIIAIADAFDAMTSNRVYRKSLGREMAEGILVEERNKQFNGELVDIFVNEILPYEVIETDETA